MRVQLNHQTNDASSSGSLLERCDKLSQLLENYNQLQRKTQIRDDYMFLTKHLAEAAGKLQLQSGAYLLLLGNKHFDGTDTIIAAMQDDPVAKVRFSLLTFRQAFTEHKNNVRNSEGQEWAKLHAEMESLTEGFKQHVNPAWEIYVRELREGWYVDESLLTSQMHINERKRLFDSYFREKNEFEKETKRIPNSQQKLDDIHQRHERLLEMREKMDLKIPPAVNEFLIASGRSHGAPLHLLTEEVLAWLTKNDDVSRYHIKRG
ncbi:hypothetical protein [Vibrio splendidus]|uniref:hypothetical protein n=1 Tax=Vibrio splendidus TaxID=29497 RepID=UPI00246965BB|nr:hypothetical protein [Vibrio splendidus]MDH6027226.1 hypothetical protein [Vibrio splendidus]